MTHPKIQAIAPIDAYWAIEEKHKSELLEAIKSIPPSEAAARLADGSAYAQPRLYEVVGTVAKLYLSGPMTKQPTSMSWLIGGTSTKELIGTIEAALADPNVRSILLVVDSPGGQVTGTSDLAQALAKAAQIKPVVAYIEDCGCSAALWVASQACEVYCNTTAMVGSIGCLYVLVDSSRAAAERGIMVYPITSSEHKAGAVDGMEVTPKQIAEIQRYVDAFAQHFCDAVAAGRSMTPEQIKTVHTGQVWIGEDAVAMGLVDAVMPLDEVLTRMQSGQIAVRTAATAGNTTTGEHIMANEPTFWEKLKSVFRAEGFDPDAAGGEDQAAATTTQEAQASTTDPEAPVLGVSVATLRSVELDPGVKAQIAALEGSIAGLAGVQLDAQAKSFADEQVRAGKATPVEHETIMGLFKTAALADGGGKIELEDAKVKEGANLQAVRAAYESRPKSPFMTESLASAGGVNVRIQPGNGNDSAEAKAAAEVTYLDATDTGKAVLAARDKEGSR